MTVIAWKGLGSMNILFLLAQSEKSAGTVIRGIAGMLIIPLVIVIIVVLTSKASKKKNKKIGDKFLEDLNAEHPFKESFKAIHFTEDGYIIHETYDGVPIDNNSILMTRTQKAMGYLAYFYKLDDIKSVMMYTHTVKMVNKYGHGNSVMSTTYMVSLLDENLRPIIPEVRCTGKMDKSLAKKIKKGDLKYVSVGFELEADSATFAQMVKRYRPDIGEVDYDQVRERLKTK